MKCDYQGDGYCDDSNNNADCDFDDGDCCLNPVNTQFCNECWCYADNTSYVSGKITGQHFFGWNLLLTYLDFQLPQNELVANILRYFL